MISHIAIDTETRLISYPDEVNPTGVCLTVAYTETQSAIFHLRKNKEHAGRVLRGWIEDPNIKIIGHNLAFDLHVLLGIYPELWEGVWAKMSAGGFSDTLLREKLYLLSTSGSTHSKPCSLADLCKRWAGLDISASKRGDDIWRMRYGELEDVGIEDWPQEAIDYAVQDALLTRKVWFEQEAARAARGPGSMNSEHIQMAAAFTLRGVEITGLDIDTAAVQELKNDKVRKFEEARQALAKVGLIRSTGTLDKRALMDRAETLWGVTKKTAKGQVATDKKTLGKVITNDPIYRIYLEYAGHLKAVTTFIPQMEIPKVHPRFTPIINTLRTSCTSSNYYKYRGQAYGKRVVRQGDPLPSINLQQIPRDSGFRKVFIPPKDHVFICADYGNLELLCAGQTYYSLFGESKLRDTLNAGLNLHDYTGCIIYNDSKGTDIDIRHFRLMIHTGDDHAKFCRQSAKFVNLGCPGGQSARTIHQLANDTGLAITPEQAEKWHEAARGQFPEYDKFFMDFLPSVQNGTMYIKVEDEITGEDVYKSKPRYDIEVCGVWRSKCIYTAAANGITMQMPAALGKKIAMARLYRAMTDPSLNSPLYGGSLHIDLHDEFLISVPETSDVELAQKAMAEIMIDGMQCVLPDMRVGVESMIMHRWGKEAEKSRPAIKIHKDPIKSEALSRVNG